ncbi:MAG: hypothetical protein UZ17_ACD001001244 [Acidobacteria bacterium OLB17]|nr:MAG: hypothetical protein UZ17_ACD001001244 [Acidobacteria bacterium OLB17]
MPHDIDLGDLRDAREAVVTPKLLRDQRIQIRLFDVKLCETIPDAARLRTLEDQCLVLCWM